MEVKFYNCIYLDKGSGTLLVNFLNSIKKNKNVISNRGGGPNIFNVKLSEKIEIPSKDLLVDRFFFLWGKKTMTLFQKNEQKKFYCIRASKI